MTEELNNLIKERSHEAIGDLTYTYVKALASGKSQRGACKEAKLSKQLADNLSIESRIGVQLTRQKIEVKDMNNNHLGGKRLYDTLSNSHIDQEKLQVLKSIKDGKWLCEIYEKSERGYQMIQSKELPKGYKHMVYQLGRDTWKVDGLPDGTLWVNCTKEELIKKMQDRGYHVTQRGEYEGLMNAIPIDNSNIQTKRKGKKSSKQIEAGSIKQTDDVKQVDFKSSTDSLNNARTTVQSFVNPIVENKSTK